MYLNLVLHIKVCIFASSNNNAQIYTQNLLCVQNAMVSIQIAPFAGLNMTKKKQTNTWTKMKIWKGIMKKNTKNEINLQNIKRAIC